MADFIEQVRATARAHGLTLPDDIPSNKIVRFPGFDKRSSNTAGWCLVFEDGRGAIIGDFSTGLRETVQAQRERPFTPPEREAFARRCREGRERAEAEEKQRRAEMQHTVPALAQKSEPAPADFPYLKARGIGPGRLRVFTGRMELRGMDCHGALMALLLDETRTPSAVQFIAADARKRYLGSTHGLYYPIGKPQDGQPLLICEGIATGQTLHECAGFAVACAMDAGNLERVARLMRSREPDRKLIIGADDDWKTKDPRTGEPKNVGLLAAQAAARAVGGLVAVPVFGRGLA